MIRAATKQDAAALQQLINQLGYTISLEDVIANLQAYAQSGGSVLVITEDNQIAGFITAAYFPWFHLHERACRITTLCINERYRQKGLGKLLVLAVEEQCRKDGCYYIELTSGAHRTGDAHPFYEALGYTIYEGKRFTKRMAAP